MKYVKYVTGRIAPSVPATPIPLVFSAAGASDPSPLVTGESVIYLNGQQIFSAKLTFQMDAPPSDSRPIMCDMEMADMERWADA